MKQLIPYFIQHQFKGNQMYGQFDAYTLFIDLSGFTPLTERLMREGSQGAEALSISLNSIFEPMVALVYQRGGFIPYFAGDAFTGIFPISSDIKPADILRTAEDIRSLFIEDGTRKTAFGDFEIGVKAGISCGEVEWGIVGQTAKSFYFRGPGINNCAYAEHYAKGQEIVLHQPFLQLINPSDLEISEVGDGYFRLIENHCDHIITSSNSTVPAVSNKVLKHFLPKAILKLTKVGEFRRVITVFISFTGLDSHAEMDRFATMVAEQFFNFSGYFKEIDFGDKGGVMLGFFGAPVSFENNIERALEFALALYQEAANIDALHIKMGITTGLAFTGIIGGEERCQYAAVGNRVNIAARLMVKATWGEILVDEEIRKAKSYRFVHKGDIRYKGLADNIPTYQLAGRKSLVKNGYAGKLMGRKKMLKQLMAFITTNLEIKQNNITYIFGEAGSGKSRLTFELHKRLKKKADLTWITCPADQILQKPFNPFISALNIFFETGTDFTLKSSPEQFERNFNFLLEDVQKSDYLNAMLIGQELQRTKSILAAQVSVFYPNSLWKLLDAKGRYQNTITALANFFRALAVIRPLVIELEDGNWYDESSREFLRQLCKEVTDLPVAIIVTSRYEDDATRTYLIKKESIEKNNFQVLEENLKTLPFKTIKKMAERLLNGATHPDFDKVLQSTTNGNPFYLEQIIAYYQEEDMLQLEDQQWNLKTENSVSSTSINSILMARIDRLSTMVKETVKAAAVIGREFDLPVLSEVLADQDDFRSPDANPISVVKTQILEAEKGQIWQSINELKYIFRHSLLRDVVYDMQLRTRLKELHLLIGRAIEKIHIDHISDRYVDLAFHFSQTDERDKTTEYLEKTAIHAKKNFQNAQSIKYFDLLIEHLDPVKDIAQVARAQLNKGGVLELIGEWDKSEKVYQEALNNARLTSQNTLLGRTYTKLGYLLLLKGLYEVARTHFEAALVYFKKEEDPVGIARVTGNLGNLFFRQGQYPQAITYLKRNAELIKTLPYHSTNAQIVSNLGLTLMNLGRYDEGIEVQKEQLADSMANGDKRGVATLYVNLGIVYFEKGDFDNALICYQEGLKFSEELGNKLLTSIAIGCIGSVYQQKGDYQKAGEHFIRDLELCEQLGDKQGIAIAVGLIGELRSIEGAFDIAMGYLENCVELCEMLGYKKGIAKAVNNLGDIHYNQGAYENALLNYRQAVDISRKINNRLVLGLSLVEEGLTLHALGRFDEAIPLSAEALAIGEELGHPDLLFQAKVFGAQVLFQQQKSPKATAQLLDLLAKTNDPEEKAALHYELYQFDQQKQDHQDKALKLYEQLYKVTPKFVYKQRMQNLTRGNSVS